MEQRSERVNNQPLSSCTIRKMNCKSKLFFLIIRTNRIVLLIIIPVHRGLEICLRYAMACTSNVLHFRGNCLSHFLLHVCESFPLVSYILVFESRRPHCSFRGSRPFALISFPRHFYSMIRMTNMTNMTRKLRCRS